LGKGKSKRVKKPILNFVQSSEEKSGQEFTPGEPQRKKRGKPSYKEKTKNLMQFCVLSGVGSKERRRGGGRRKGKRDVS